MNQTLYKWLFYHKKYGKIECEARNIEEFWNFLKYNYQVDLKSINKDTIVFSVRHLDGNALSKEELNKVFVYNPVCAS